MKLTGTEGITVEYLDETGKDTAASAVEALAAQDPKIIKMLAKSKYDKIKVGPLGAGLNGQTEKCPYPSQPDITLSDTNYNRATLPHEIGHALNDILGEQNNRGLYSDSDAFNACLLYTSRCV